jgi:hypothetical protein
MPTSVPAPGFGAPGTDGPGDRQLRALLGPPLLTGYAALKFLDTFTLQRPWDVEHLPFPTRLPRLLPTLLHPEELQALFAAFTHPKFHALFMICSAAGLRSQEAANS